MWPLPLRNQGAWRQSGLFLWRWEKKKKLKNTYLICILLDPITLKSRQYTVSLVIINNVHIVFITCMFCKIGNFLFLCHYYITMKCENLWLFRSTSYITYRLQQYKSTIIYHEIYRRKNPVHGCFSKVTGH